MANFKASTLGRTAVTAAVRFARLFASAIAPWCDVDKCYYYIAAYGTTILSYYTDVHNINVSIWLRRRVTTTVTILAVVHYLCLLLTRHLPSLHEP